MKSSIIAFCLLMTYCINGFSAGFECAKASTNIEKIICSSETLNKLDETNTELFKQLKSEHPDSTFIINDQKSWIKLSRNACTEERCLIDSYKSRNNVFKNLLKAKSNTNSSELTSAQTTAKPEVPSEAFVQNNNTEPNKVESQAIQQSQATQVLEGASESNFDCSSALAYSDSSKFTTLDINQLTKTLAVDLSKRASDANAGLTYKIQLACGQKRNHECNGDLDCGKKTYIIEAASLDIIPTSYTQVVAVHKPQAVELTSKASEDNFDCSSALSSADISKFSSLNIDQLKTNVKEDFSEAFHANSQLTNTIKDACTQMITGVCKQDFECYKKTYLIYASSLDVVRTNYAKPVSATQVKTPEQVEKIKNVDNALYYISIILIILTIILFVLQDSKYKKSEGCEKVREIPAIALAGIIIYFLVMLSVAESYFSLLLVIVGYSIPARYFIIEALGYVLVPSEGVIYVPGSSRDADSFIDFLNPKFLSRYLFRETILIESIRGISQREESTFDKSGRERITYILNVSTKEGNRIMKFRSAAKCDRLNDLFVDAMDISRVNLVQK